MVRPTIIAGNWKMNKTIREATQFLEALIPHAKQAKCEIFIAPSFIAVQDCAKTVRETKIKIGAQNMSDQEEGALTGEVSARMLRDAGARFVILGHSERRTLFKETDQYIHAKLKRAVLEGLPPILCIGENEKERENGDSAKVLKRQLDHCLQGFIPDELQHLIIAYEPVWAIGTGKAATPEMAQDAHAIIRAHVAKNWDPKLADRIPILYGGSVKPNNIENFLKQRDIDGALIGGAALDVDVFKECLKSKGA